MMSLSNFSTKEKHRHRFATYVLGNAIFRMVKEMEDGGYGNRKVVLVSDGEASIKAVKDAMIAIREPETIPEETPVGEHNANLAEGMVRRVREQARVIISRMESGAGGKISKDADILQWVIKLAADLI